MAGNSFDEVLDLEEGFYDEGYQHGLSDGVWAGRIEGRTLGLEKGFEKYLAIGKLHGKSLVWGNRAFKPSSNDLDARGTKENIDKVPVQIKVSTLPRLSSNPRVAKHLSQLCALVEADSLSTENTEDAVADFDERLKRGQVKSKIIERMVEVKVSQELPQNF